MESINKLNKDWHDSLTTTFRSFLQPTPSKDRTCLIPYLKSLHPRKTISISEPPSKSQLPNTLPQNNNNNSHWSNKKIVSKENIPKKKTFYGSHINEFVECFNDYYSKIESKLDPTNGSLTFDQILIDNPFARHILDMKTKRSRVKKHFRSN